MSRLGRVINNTLLSLLGQMVTWTSTLLLTIAYGRFLGDTGFGELYLALTFVALVGFPMEFGFNQQLTRDIAQKPHEALRYLSNILIIKGCLWILLYGVILLSSYLLKYSPIELTLIAICGLGLLSDGVANVFASLQYAREQVKVPVIGGMLQKGLSALVGLIILKYGVGVQIMALVLLGGSLTNMLWQAFWGFRAVGLRLALDIKLIRELLRTCIPFIIYGVLAVIYYRVDTVLLSFMANTAVIGWYGAAYRLLDTLNFLPNLVIFAIMYPIFSKLSISNESNLKLAVEKSMNFLLFCGVPIATLMIVTAPNIIGFLYHQQDFVHSVPALQALAPGLVFLYANTVLGTTIMSIKQEKKITIMAALALVFNVGLNLILIPRYEHIGAAAVTSLTELLLLGLSIYFTPRQLLPVRSIVVGLKSIIASAVMTLAIWEFLPYNIFLILPIALVAYLAASVLFRTIPREDVRAIYAAIRRKASGAAVAQIEQPIAEQEAFTEELIGDPFFLADEDTTPLRAVYHLQKKTPPVQLTEDDIETVPMKASHPDRLKPTATQHTASGELQPS
jgi:O-antigen/teichoic acid export membrane protein